MKILIVEDDHKIAHYLKKGLEEQGYTVSTVHDGAEGLFIACEHNFDLIILDVMLPKINGWELMQRLQDNHNPARVLFLTAKDTVADRVHGLDLGADDYLVKPFSFSELLARVRATLRKSTVHNSNTMKIADLEIDCTKHHVKRNNKNIALTKKEFQLLTFLARRTGEVLSRTVISEHVWNINFDCDSNIVDAVIRRLRSKLNDNDAANMIHTVRGVGYVFKEK